MDTQAVYYLPIATTVISIAFFLVLMHRYRSKSRGLHLLWWAIGVFVYGLGTALEGTITIFGNSIWLNKLWYIVGAVLGAYPLAQGTVYLLLRRRTAHILTITTMPIIALIATFIILSPVNLSVLESHRPSGAILGWQWVRILTPVINGYAAFFLIGGALLSSWRFAKRHSTLSRAIGNALIAVGALMPGIGGGMAKAGVVEALYIGEFIGIILIWVGYTFCIRTPLSL